MGKLEGKVAVITGASKGIGEGIAKVYAKYGAKCVLAARGPKVLELAEELRKQGYEAIGVQTDVSDFQSVEKLVCTAEGDIHFFAEDAEAVMGYVREWKGQKLVVLCNLHDRMETTGWKKEWDAYRQILGNYKEDVTPGVLRPYEVAVLVSTAE